MAPSEQMTIDLDERARAARREATTPASRDGRLPLLASAEECEAAARRAARDSLRAQIARLERELSRVVVAGFPYVPAAPRQSAPRSAPTLPGIEELERHRDTLVGRLRDAQSVAAERARHESRSRALLEEMELEPARHKFARLRVTDVGGRGCGVYEVRPRLGLIGMLAGWWQLTLSSGCPLAKGRALSARPEADPPARLEAGPPETFAGSSLAA